MSKYIINFAIGAAIIVPATIILILFAAYPAVGYLFFIPLFMWGCYYVGMVIKDLWEGRHANRSTRM